MPQPVTAPRWHNPPVEESRHAPPLRSTIADPMIDEVRQRASWACCQGMGTFVPKRVASAQSPVGGAPSRSGFLATPTDASPRSTFSELLRIPGEEMPCSPPESTHREPHGHRKAVGLTRPV